MDRFRLSVGVLLGVVAAGDDAEPDDEEDGGVLGAAIECCWDSCAVDI